MMGRREGGQGQFFYSFDLDKVVPPETLMTYESARRVRHGKWSRRSFIQATGAGIAAGAVGGVFPNRVKAAEGLRSIGLGVSEINEIQNNATKDPGFTIAGQAMGYGECLMFFFKQKTAYEIGEWY